MSADLLGFVASTSGGFYYGPLASEAGTMSGTDIRATAGVTRSLGRIQDEAQPDSMLRWLVIDAHFHLIPSKLNYWYCVKETEIQEGNLSRIILGHTYSHYLLIEQLLYVTQQFRQALGYTKCKNILI